MATSLMCSTSRLCSAWNTWWTAVSPMFSLPRPSPVTEVRVEQLVVVGRRLEVIADWPSGASVGVGTWGMGGLVLDRLDRTIPGSRVCAMSFRKACPVRRRSGRRHQRCPRPTSSAAGIRFDETRRGHELRQAVRAGDELAVRIGGEQRYVEDVEVGQLDAEHVRGLRLDLGPVADAADWRHRSAGRWLTRPHWRSACHSSVDGRRSAYSRRKTWCEAMRGVGLVLVDERRRLVVVAWTSSDVPRMPSAPGCRVGGARQHHEVRSAAGRGTNSGSSGCSGM